MNDTDHEWCAVPLSPPRSRRTHVVGARRPLGRALRRFIGVLVNVGLRLTQGGQVGCSPLVFPAATSLGFFAIFRLTFAASWTGAPSASRAVVAADRRRKSRRKRGSRRVGSALAVEMLHVLGGVARAGDRVLREDRLRERRYRRATGLSSAPRTSKSCLRVRAPTTGTRVGCFAGTHATESCAGVIPRWAANAWKRAIVAALRSPASPLKRGSSRGRCPDRRPCSP